MEHFCDHLSHLAFQLIWEIQLKKFMVYFSHFGFFVFRFIVILSIVLEFLNRSFVICFFVRYVLKLGLIEFIWIFLLLGSFYVKCFDLLLFINFSKNLICFTVFSLESIDCKMVLLKLSRLFLEASNY